MISSLYGKYRHYKTNQTYEVIGVAIHSETYEEMIIYKALYECEKFGLNQTWVRPKKMFFENVEHNGLETPRFKRVNEDLEIPRIARINTRNPILPSTPRGATVL